jgi:hypothetical protein
MPCGNVWDGFTIKVIPQRRKHQKLIHVGDCLYRSSLTDVYYAIFERDGRQVKRSLKTIDPELAKRRLDDHRKKVERLTSDNAKSPRMPLIMGVTVLWRRPPELSKRTHYRVDGFR